MKVEIATKDDLRLNESTLLNGVSIEFVSKMMSHKNIRSTQIYAKIVDKKVANDMKKLKNKKSMGRYRYLINYRVLNLLAFIVLIICIQQSNLFTLERFYTILMVFCVVLLFGLIFKLPYINKIWYAISSLFDEKNIDCYIKAAKTITIISCTTLLFLFLLSFFVDKSIVYWGIIVISSIYAIVIVMLISYLIISAKSFFYYYLQGNAATISSKDNVNTYHLPIFKSSPLVDCSNNQLREENYEVNNSENEPNIHNKIAVLKELFLPVNISYYVPLFVIIDKLYVTRDVENRRLSRKLHALIARLSDGKQRTIKNKFNDLRRDETYKNSVRPIMKALYNKGEKPINDIEKYKEIAIKMLEAFNSTYFKIPKEKSDEFVILCVLYFSIFVDRNYYPDITDLIKEVNCRPSLLKGLKKILD